MSRNPQHNPSYKPKVVQPRKVRGGIKLTSQTGAYPESWAAQRWVRLVEAAAPGAAMVAGLEYARNGQTRTLALEPGWVRGTVQGTVISAYKTSIAMPTLTHAESERVISTMVDQAVYAAKLLAGELPANIEDVFAPLGLRLFPSEPGDLTPKCNCRDVAPAPIPGGPQRGSVGMSSFRSSTPPPAPVATATPVAPPAPRGGWCKHACCLGYLVAERLMTDPFLIFTLRGLPREELLERLRQRRAVVGAGDGTVAVYAPVVPGVSDVEAPPLEECVDNFWELGPELSHVDMPVVRPEVSHPLLRRLGPSPFGAGQGKFPLVGLLATCYEVISEAVVKAEENEAEITEPAQAEELEDAPGAESETPKPPPLTIPDPNLGPLDEDDELA
jgi:uncharacterized Zn finger protein